MGQGAANARAATLYTVSLPIVVIGAIAATYGAFFTVRGTSLGRGSLWLDFALHLALNLAVPAVAGLTAALLLARIARRRRWYGSGWLGHVARAGSAYLLTLALVTGVAVNYRAEAFGLVAQLFIWPIAALVAFLAADVFLSMRTRAPAV